MENLGPVSPYKGPHCSPDLPKARDMRICAGPVGQQSGNVEKVLVFKAHFEGSKEQRVPPMTSELRICKGLVGPKNGNVEKVLVFIVLVEGSRTFTRQARCVYVPARRGSKAEMLKKYWFL